MGLSKKKLGGVIDIFMLLLIVLTVWYIGMNISINQLLVLFFESELIHRILYKFAVWFLISIITLFKLR